MGGFYHFASTIREEDLDGRRDGSRIFHAAVIRRKHGATTIGRHTTRRIGYGMTKHRSTKVVTVDALSREGGNGAGKFESLVTLLDGLVRSEFTGSIKVNFTQGGIGRIEKLEEIGKRL